MMRSVEEAKDDLRAQVLRFADSVWPLYRLLLWRWGIGREGKTPGFSDITKTLRELIDRLNEKDLNWQSGGLCVEIETDSATGEVRQASLSFTYSKYIYY